jgi:hypothetical protein
MQEKLIHSDALVVNFITVRIAQSMLQKASYASSGSARDVARSEWTQLATNFVRLRRAFNGREE